MTPMRLRMQSEDGATAVLFALVLPILLSLLAFGTEVLAMAGADRELQRTADQAALTAAAQIPLVNLGGVQGLDRNQILAQLTPDAASPLDDACTVAAGNAEQSALLTGFAREVPTCVNGGITITPVVTSPSLVTQTQALLAALDDELSLSASLQSQINANLTAPGTTLDLDSSTTGGVATPPPIATVFDTLAALGLPLELSVLAPALTVSQMRATAGTGVSTPMRTLISDDAFTDLEVTAVAQRRFKNVLLLPIIDLGCQPQPIRLTNEVIATFNDAIGQQALAQLLIAYGTVVENVPPPVELPDSSELPTEVPTLDPPVSPSPDPEPSIGVPEVDPDPDPDVDPDPQPNPEPEPPPVPEIPVPDEPEQDPPADGGDAGTGQAEFQAAQLIPPVEVIPPSTSGAVGDGLGDGLGVGDGLGDGVGDGLGGVLEEAFQPYTGLVDGLVVDLEAFLATLIPTAVLPVTPGGTLADPPGSLFGIADPLVAGAIDDLNTLLGATGLVGQLGTGCEINLNEVVTPIAVQRLDEVLRKLEQDLPMLEPTVPGAGELASLIADARLDLMDLLNPGTDAPTATEILRAAATADEDVLVVVVGSTQIPALDFMIRPAQQITDIIESRTGAPIGSAGEVTLDVQATMQHVRVDADGQLGVQGPDVTGLPSQVGSLLSTTTQARGLFRATLVD